MLAAPLNVRILRALSAGPRQQADLQREAGLPAQTTLRAHLQRLADLGAIERHRRNGFPWVVELELTASGRELLFVVEALQRWLELAPGGPLPAGDGRAKAAIRALAEGWSTTMLRALAAGPLTLTELDGLIGALNYPSLERRLAALRLADLVKPEPGSTRGTPYAVTDWLRRGVAPLSAAARWERRHAPATTQPITRLDAEAALLLAVRLPSLAADLSGACRMAVEISSGGVRRLAGVTAQVEEGRVTACSTSLQGNPDAWALGPPAAWLDAVIEHDAAGLEIGGDCRLARSFLDGIHETLFGARRKLALDVENAIRDDGSN